VAATGDPEGLQSYAGRGGMYLDHKYNSGSKVMSPQVGGKYGKYLVERMLVAATGDARGLRSYAEQKGSYLNHKHGRW
jgi:hypothetical protein